MIEYARGTLLKNELKSLALPSDGTFFLESGEGCSMTVFEQFLVLLDIFAVKQAFNKKSFTALNEVIFIEKIAEILKDVNKMYSKYYYSFFRIYPK